MFTDATGEEGSAAESPSPGQQWRIWIPLAAVIVALVALVVIPVLRTRVVAPVHDDLQSGIEPGRNLVTRIHVALAVDGVLVHHVLERPK